MTDPEPKKKRRPGRPKDPTSRARARSDGDGLGDPKKSYSGIVLFSKTERRLAQVEQWLSSGLTPRQAARRAREEFGFKTRSQANAYVSTVLKRWHMDAEQEPKESRRNRLRATLENAIVVALARKKLVRLGRDSLKDVPDPDVRAVARLTQTLALLDGLIDRTGQLEAEAREQASREIEAFVATVRGALDPETWARVDRAIGEAGGRARAGEAAPSQERSGADSETVHRVL